jgi:hypothetical protein
MKPVLIIAGIVILVASAVLWGYIKGIGKMAEEEQQQIRQQMADEPFSCCYEDHDVSGLIEED